MSFKIITKQILTKRIKQIDIVAPNIARKIQPGQFVSVCPEEGDEHIPLTVASHDLVRGHISLIFSESGHIAHKLGALKINESIFSILGPLGQRAQIKKEGIVVCIASGIGIAQILPICREFKGRGNKIVGIIGAQTKRKLILEAQMRIVCDKILIATEDGSYERKGLATDLLQDFLDQNNTDCVYAIGSVNMMRTASTITKDKKIKTLVKLNPVMTDCTGLCGSCRVKVGGKMVLACVEGPEFNGHKVDYEDLDIRMSAYEESGEWDDQQLKHSPVRNESKTLTKFLSGILKN